MSMRLELPGGGRVLFTDRTHGSVDSEDGREELRRLIGVEGFARGRQVHGSVVRSVSELDAGDPLVEADGQATSAVGVGAMVLSADCLPVALGCDGAVAMVHAGWRGLAAGVIEEGVRAIQELGEGGGTVAIVGPSAGACCYEVGPEVHDAFARARRDGDRVDPPTTSSCRIDLRAIAHERLLAAGVAEVRDVLACTICDERFFSYRREGERAGRQAGVAWLS
ncbi:MAG TPA: polyphenol oxidase family protein [Solirubrobacteraceae bacterium]|nr:polyphenol oxidase family protein [Solirubrobacteraceae bacterium]